MKLMHLRFVCLSTIFLLIFSIGNAQTEYGENQPYSSFWFIDQLLDWKPETDPHASFNVSKVALQTRFKDANTQIHPELSTEPSIVSLVPSHPTSNHPSQGFSTVEQYAFPYWQYIDYFVQWGGSSAEGIVVTPAVPWIDVAHLNGVKILGTVFFPPNVYGGKEEWVREFLQKDTQGNFPVADKLLEVAEHYGFEGWFINQETKGMNQQDAEDMQAFLIYYQKKSNKKFMLMWYDAMIEDGRVIWQDELNHHNSMYFQKEKQKLSDIMFIDFGWSSTQIEDSHKRAKKLGRKPWEIYSGIDVQSRSYKTPVNWEGIYKEGKPFTTSIGLYWPSSTFDIAKDKQPESVYEEEQKFWNGTLLKGELPSWQNREWKGFANYIPARSTINKMPFVTNFNYGLGRFYNEKGKRLSNKAWHNLSNQNTLPTWQWDVDTTKVNVTFNFKESYTGGSSVKVTTKKRIKRGKIPLYKTQIELNEKETISMVAKGTGKLALVVSLNDGKDYNLPVTLNEKWTKTAHSLKRFRGKKIVKLGLEVEGHKGDHIYVGELSVKNKNAIKVTIPNVAIQSFIKGDSAELYVHIEGHKNSAHHNIYQVDSKGNKTWLGRTRSTDYYVASLKKGIDYKYTSIQVVSVANDGSKSKASVSKVYWK